MRNIKYIILHHSATKVTGDGSALADAIMLNHRRRWVASFPDYICDYHYMIGPSGKIFKGQPEEFPGWHATNYRVNLESIGICFLGNFEVAVMTKEQFSAGVNLIKDLVSKYGIKSENVLRHKDVVSDATGLRNSTLCPGKNFPYEEMLVSVFSIFKDIEENYPYKEEIKTLYNLGIIYGDSVGIRPKSFLTREEGFLLIYRVLKFLGKI